MSTSSLNMSGHIYPDGVKIDSRGRIYIGQNPRDPHAPLAGKIFVVDAAGKLLKTISLPSPGVPNFAFSPDEKTLYVTALDVLDKAPLPRQDLCCAQRMRCPRGRRRVGQLFAGCAQPASQPPSTMRFDPVI